MFIDEVLLKQVEFTCGADDGSTSELLDGSAASLNTNFLLIWIVVSKETPKMTIGIYCTICLRVIFWDMFA